VLRNKVAEITRFLPTSLMVKRNTTNNDKGRQNAQNNDNYQSSNNSSGFFNTNNNNKSGPYDYMSQQQKQYSAMNPLHNINKNTNTSKSEASQDKKGATSTDAAYEAFMNDISKLI
jgi:hypothetical protein